jgi:hypothetical protein
MNLWRRLRPKQRQLLTVGALTPEMCTPQQLEILNRMNPYLEGLNLQQTAKLAVLDEFAEGYEKGQESGRNLTKNGRNLFRRFRSSTSVCSMTALRLHLYSSLQSFNLWLNTLVVETILP